jgi:hypothetical protein
MVFVFATTLAAARLPQRTSCAAMKRDECPVGSLRLIGSAKQYTYELTPPLPKRTQTVRTIKPHQHRIKRPIPIPQQIMPSHQIRSLAVKPEQAE